MKKVIFKKPKIEKGLTAVDMHFHTTYSVDGFPNIKDLIKALNKKQIGVGITDHNEIRGVIEASKYKSNLIIPGIEATCREGAHVIFYFYNIKDLKNFYKKEVKPYKTNDPFLRLNRDILDFLDSYKKYNGVSCAPHACASGWVSINKLNNLDDIIQKIDIIEVITAYNTRKGNEDALKLSKRKAKASSGGSDGHTIYELGKVLTYAKAKTPEEFIEAILSKQAKVVGLECNFLEKTFLSLIKEIKYISREKNLSRLKYSLASLRNARIKNGRIYFYPPSSF